MEVILLKDVDGIGLGGERKNVKDGYALNFLFPNKYAMRVTKGNVKAVSDIQKSKEAQLIRFREKCNALAEKIANTSCTITRNAGEDDKLFGSVTNDDIANCFKENGVEVDKRKIILAEPIKKIGMYQVNVKLHSDITAQAKVWVVKE